MPAAAFVAQQVLAQQLEIPLDQIQIMGIETVDYPDSCLGAPTPNEVCTQLAIPGLRVQLIGQGMVYEFHTDAAGYDIRQFGAPQPVPSGEQYRRRRFALPASRDAVAYGLRLSLYFQIRVPMS